MQRAFSTLSAAARVAPARWRHLLHAAFTQAQQQSAALARPIVVSVTVPADWSDPIAIFLAAAGSDGGLSTYWERPAQHEAFVGIGSAVTIATPKVAAIATAAQRWHALIADAVVACEDSLAEQQTLPVALGGFAFDPLHPTTELWQGFAAGQLTLPRLLARYDAGQMTLTFAELVDATTNSAAAIDALLDLATALPPANTPVADLLPQSLTLHELVDQQDWMAQVSAATTSIRRGDLSKVVLARGVVAQGAIDVGATLLQLRRSQANAYCFAVRRGGRTFAGATPELLLRVQQGVVQTMALAGSAPRGATAVTDELLGNELLHSDKNAGEHAVVVRQIYASLAPLCTALDIPAQPQLLRTPQVQHLQTPITGTLRPGFSLLDGVAALHPTPAVGGYPRATALRLIRELEGLDRGWYAGPIGWVDASGAGEFAVALRSGLLESGQATLFAGCGIVADSDPATEYRESQMKLRVMLRALGAEA